MQPTIDTKSQVNPPAVDSILHAQQQSWNKFSAGWRKWDDFTMRFLEPQGSAILKALHVSDGARVLDIATGTGDPGLTLAATMRGVRVTALDASEGMLHVARDKAASIGLANFETVLGDACTLDFADESFDAISCRLGFMFFPDPRLAAREMARVLRPGGAVATTVWAAPGDNPWVTTFLAALKAHVDVPSPPPGGPGLFRCADSTVVPELFASAGLRVEQSESLCGEMPCDSLEEYWEFMTEVVPPAVAALSSATASESAAIKSEVFTALSESRPPASRRLGWSAHHIVARK